MRSQLVLIMLLERWQSNELQGQADRLTQRVGGSIPTCSHKKSLRHRQP